MNKYLLFMTTGFIVSCASFNSPYRGRVISSVDDPSFLSTEKGGHVFIKTTYNLSSKKQGIHEVQIPMSFSFAHHSDEKMFTEKKYSFSLSGNDFSCYDGYYLNKKLIPNTEYIVSRNGLLDYSNIKCRNSSGVENSKVEVTYKIQKSEEVRIENLSQYSVSSLNLDSDEMSKNFKHIYTNHMKYLSNPSIYSDHLDIHKSIGKKENIKFQANTYGYQLNYKLSPQSGIIISPPKGKIKIHKVGELSAKGTLKKKTKRNFLDKEKQAYALICKVTRKDGSIWTYDFSKYSKSRLAFNNQETIQCGINQPNKKRRLKKSSGAIEVEVSILTPELIENDFVNLKESPQSYLDQLIQNSNDNNISQVQTAFENESQMYQSKIQNERDISSIAPALRTVKTKSSSSTFVFKPTTVKVVHEGKPLYFIDYDVYASSNEYFPEVFDSFTKKLNKHDVIDIRDSLSFSLRTNIQYTKEEHNKIMSSLYHLVGTEDKDDFIQEVSLLSKEKYVTPEQIKILLAPRKSLRNRNIVDKDLSITRVNLQVCADMKPYTKELSRGEVLKTQVVFNKVLSFYNHKDQLYKFKQFQFKSDITPITIKTNLDFSRTAELSQCFPINSKDLADRNFKQFISQK
jgi:hypothetical protein